MQVCKYASMHIYTNMQVCKYVSMQVCTYMQVCTTLLKPLNKNLFFTEFTILRKFCLEIKKFRHSPDKHKYTPAKSTHSLGNQTYSPACLCLQVLYIQLQDYITMSYICLLSSNFNLSSRISLCLVIGVQTRCNET